MRDYLCEDTITAIATPLGRGAIGIVRISGRDSLRILREVFRTKKGGRKELFEDRKMYYGVVVDSAGEPMDEVLVVYMKAPRTFTGEDTVEIHAHGGFVVLRKILREVIKRGARLAEPGEFTMRAFLHQKIDLIQAEAIIELINARSELEAGVALKHLEGRLSKEVRRLRDQLLELKAHVEVAVDFPEEDIEIIETYQVKEKLSALVERITALLSTYKNGCLIREGIKVVIVGKPNVGKSSLLNAILEEDRAIVTEVPGTTRDIIEEATTLRGIPIRLLDTAGIRDASDTVERIGVKRSIESVRRADVVLFVVDGSKGIDEEDKRIAEILRAENVILVLNKKDLGLKVNCRKLKEWKRCVEVSAKTGDGLEELARKLTDAVLLDTETILKGDEPLITSERHRELLEKARASLLRAIQSIDSGFESPEFLSMDIDTALNALGEMVGQVTTEDMLGIIFSQFCIGK